MSVANLMEINLIVVKTFHLNQKGQSHEGECKGITTVIMSNHFGTIQKLVLIHEVDISLDK